jgi:hypothetical protein
VRSRADKLRGLGGSLAGDVAEWRYYRGGWHGPGTLRLTAAEYATVEVLATRAAAAEASITPRLGTVVDGLPHARLTGLEYRLKGTDSLARKVATELADPEVKETAAAVGARTKDVVRYTVQIPGGSYAAEVGQAASALKGQGFEFVDWKNTWTKPGYPGINSFWREPGSGQVFEIQFHTPESFEAKMVTHEIYERSRLPGVDGATRAALRAEQDQVFTRVPRPDGAAGLTKETLFG